MTADITLRGPGDVVAVLPYQLGYQPHDSVVAVSMRGRRVGLVARVDLPPNEHVEAVAATLVGPVVRDGATSVVVVGFEDVPDASLPLCTALVERLERAGVEVLDVAVVRDGRRYSAICSDPCCPPEGVPLPEPADVPGIAELVAMGRSPLPSREAVDRVVEADPQSCAGVADAVLARSQAPARRRRRRAAAAWRVVLRDPAGEWRRAGARGPGALRARTDALGPRADPVVVADLALGLHDVAWRDGLIAWLAPGVLPVDRLDADVVQLLRSSLPAWGGMGFLAPSGGAEVDGSTDGDATRRAALAVMHADLGQRLLALCRSVPDECPDEAAAVCTVAAHVAWAQGDGALARSAVERALRLRPDYRLAVLLEQLIEGGVRLPVRSRPRREPGALGWAG